ncbi:hypothetical protein EDE15_3565 [Edaphobacter aggregans]|uniref:Uncharacterized protein n=1 Tax=Edaphobacter aggregans TaxID=570835 RepID=A0A3R9NVV3_9BACT|nr:hypothetical protein [Edaphobacter aggregans]RSL18009.1 hypothetical protein EDE15_3565 [Edaphobacter aggregans]
MALQQVPGDLQSTTGKVETIEIVPDDPTTVISIVSVLYGTNANGPIPVPIKVDGKTFDLTILAGNNLLQITLFSPNSTDGFATAQQPPSAVGKPPLELEGDIEFFGGLAIWSPNILGA